jgi:hypothetical protein
MSEQGRRPRPARMQRRRCVALRATWCVHGLGQAESQGSSPTVLRMNPSLPTPPWQSLKMYRAKQQAEVDARMEATRRADAHRAAEKALLASAAAELELRRQTEQRLAAEKKHLAILQVGGPPAVAVVHAVHHPITLPSPVYTCAPPHTLAPLDAQERLKVEDLLSGRTRDNMSINVLAKDAAKARWVGEAAAGCCMGPGFRPLSTLLCSLIATNATVSLAQTTLYFHTPQCGDGAGYPGANCAASQATAGG